MNKVVVRSTKEPIGIGSLWQHEDGEVYILAVVETYRVTLINLYNGCRYTTSVKALKTKDLTEFEWQKVTGLGLEKFIRVYDIQIKAERGGNN